ncbi:MAG TPA: DUF6134 family protein, partial [Stellaceae bacterium]|nr:DUF6134 family protein [Stellaceae bacterium]
MRAMSLRPIFAAAFAIACTTAARAAPPPDPLALYGPEIVFSVWRSGSEIGQHRVLFARDGGVLVARSLLDLAVKVLGITVYRYTYRAEETWRGGRLERLRSSVDDNGTPARVEAKAEQDKLAVTGPAGDLVIGGAVLPSTHWD